MPDPLVFVVNSTVFGGGEVFVLRLAEALRAQSREVAIACPRHSSIYSAATALGLERIEIDLGRKLGRATWKQNLVRSPTAKFALRRMMRSLPEKTWIVLQYKWEQLLWGGQKGGRVVMLEHGPVPQALRSVFPARRRLRAAYLRSDALVAASTPAASSVEGICGVSPTLVLGGSDMLAAKEAVAARDRTRRNLGLGSEDRLAIYAGRLAENKGVIDFARAIRGAEGWRGLLIGEGPAEEDLLAVSRERGGDSLHLLPRQADVLPFIAAADVAVLLTRDPGEGRPLFAVEAAAVGTPILALGSSHAMRSFAEERLGSVTLIGASDVDTVSDGLLCIGSGDRPESAGYRWDETAATFLAAIEGSMSASRRG